MNRELVIRVNPLLELVMIKTGKVLVTVRIINDLNGHREKQPGKAGQGVRVYMRSQIARYLRDVSVFNSGDTPATLYV